MAVYNKDYFDKLVKENGLKFSDSDLHYIESMGDYDYGVSLAHYKQQYQNAQTPEQRAALNSAANKLREESYGYSGGKDGSYYLQSQKSPGDFTYSSAPEFSYDMAADPVYQSYQKQYAREGQRATENTLGSAAAMTGGIPSSYAVAAASQQGDYYASQMADKVPELYDQAYSRYLSQLGQWNTDRNFAYGQHLDEYESQKYDAGKKQDDASWMAGYGDYSGLEGLGVNTGTIKEQQAYERRQSELDDRLNEAKFALSAGDYQKVYDLTGIRVQQADSSFENDLSMAQLGLKAGDWGPYYSFIAKYRT